MLNRRFLRMKAMQSLYAFFQTENDNINSGERELLKNIDKIYDLYLYQLSLLTELAYFAERSSEEAKLKHLPSKEEIFPNKKFAENRFLQQINENNCFKTEIRNRGVSWAEYPELIKKIYNSIKTTDEFNEFLENKKDSYTKDKEIILKLYRNYIGDFHDLLNLYEEKSIYWADDIEIAHMLILNTFKIFNEKTSCDDKLSPLFDDAPMGEDLQSEDRKFMIDLYRKTIIHNKEYEKLISEKTDNWEIERIAMIDVLLMKMALCEITEFPTIPVKATLNEYIELSKIYSSAKSKVFINGVLDKMVSTLKKQGLIKKIGRGLIEK